MPINTLPTPPQRSDPANFSARADTFVAALQPFADQANALAIDVNTKQVTASTAATAASTSASQAAQKVQDAQAIVTAGQLAINQAIADQSADIDGKISSQAAAAAATQAATQAIYNATASVAGVTGWVSGQAYAAGEAVWSLVTFQTYRRSMSGAGTIDPSQDAANWELLTSGLGRVMSQSLATSLVLSVNTADMFVLSATKIGLSVTLPVANTLRTGKEYAFRNSGVHPFAVRAADGSILRVVYPSESLRVVCDNTSTVRGSWITTGITAGYILPVYELVKATVDGSSASAATFIPGPSPIAKMSDTLIVYVTVNGGFVYLTAHNLSTGAVGSPAVLPVNTSAQVESFVISPSKGVILWSVFGTPSGAVFNVSGTTVTVGTVYTQAASLESFNNSLGFDGLNFLQVSAETFVTGGVAYNASTQMRYNAASVITVSGDTVTIGPVVGKTSQTVSNPTTKVAILSVDSSRAIIVTASSSGMHCNVFNFVTSTFLSTLTSPANGGGMYCNGVLEINKWEWWILTSSSGNTSPDTIRRVLLAPDGTLTSVSGALTSPSGSTYYSYDNKMPSIIKYSNNAAQVFSLDNSQRVTASKVVFNGSAFSVTPLLARLWEVGSKISYQGGMPYMVVPYAGYLTVFALTDTGSEFKARFQCGAQASGAVYASVTFKNNKLYISVSNPSTEDFTSTEVVVLDTVRWDIIERKNVRRSIGSTLSRRTELIGSLVITVDTMASSYASLFGLAQGLYMSAMEVA
jgi:hypothetical protein